MAHLACTDHKRRVVVFGTVAEPVTVHRNGDGSRCDSDALGLGGKHFTPRMVVAHGIGYSADYGTLRNRPKKTQPKQR